MKIESSGEYSTHQDQDDGEDVMNTRNTTSVTGEGTAGERVVWCSQTAPRKRVGSGLYRNSHLCIKYGYDTQ